MAHLRDNRRYEYIAFISYKREDEKWAKWLQRKLEYYKLPSSIRKNNPNLPDRIRPVFKDTTDLEPGVLTQKIQEALNSSKFLIVICSPRSANSTWVSKEAQSFIDSERADKIIPFIISGKPNATDPKDECYPESLRQLAGEQELLGANINELGRNAAAVKVVARMFNLRFDTLWQRFERARMRNNLISTFVTVISVIVAVCMIYLYLDRDRAYINLEIANSKIKEEKNLVKKAQSATEQINQHLLQANEKILQGNRQLKKANDSIHIVNIALTLAQHNLAQRNRDLQQANRDILTRQSNLMAAQILSITESGDIPGAKSLILANYSPNGNRLRLPVTSKSERAIRQIESLSHQCNFIHWNSVPEIPISHLLSESNNKLIGFQEGNIVEYDLNKSEIINQIECQGYKNIQEEIEYTGFLNSCNSKLGITTSDSIYVFNAKNGNFISKHPYHYMGGFRILNDSVMLSVNLLGNIDMIDSKTFKKKQTGIGGLNPIFPTPFEINSKEQVVYVDSSQCLICRDIENGDTIWQKRFDYQIADDIGLMDEFGTVAVINKLSNNVELWSTDNWSIISNWCVPTSSKYQLLSSDVTTLSLLTSGNINSKFDKWVVPYQQWLQHFNAGRIYDSRLNYYADNNNITYFHSTNNEAHALFCRTEDDGFSIIKTSVNGLLATAKIEDESRLIYIDLSSGDPDFHLVSYLSGNDSWDWQHGYISFLNNHKPRILRSQAFTLPYSSWNQCTDISNDRQFVAAALFSNQIFVRDVKNRVSIHFEMPSEVFSVKFTPDSKHIIIVTEKGLDIFPIDAIDKSDNIKLNHLLDSGNTFSKRPCLAALSNTGDKLAIGYMNGKIHIYSYPEMTVDNTLNFPSHIVYFAFNNEGNKIAVILNSKELIVCDMVNGQEIYHDIIPFEPSNVFFDETGKNIIVHSDMDSMIYPFEDIEFIINNMK